MLTYFSCFECNGASSVNNQSLLYSKKGGKGKTVSSGSEAPSSYLRVLFSTLETAIQLLFLQVQMFMHRPAQWPSPSLPSLRAGIELWRLNCIQSPELWAWIPLSIVFITWTKPKCSVPTRLGFLLQLAILHILHSFYHLESSVTPCFRLQGNWKSKQACSMLYQKHVTWPWQTQVIKQPLVLCIWTCQGTTQVGGFISIFSPIKISHMHKLLDPLINMRKCLSRRL